MHCYKIIYHIDFSENNKEINLLHSAFTASETEVETNVK